MQVLLFLSTQCITGRERRQRSHCGLALGDGDYVPAENGAWGKDHFAIAPLSLPDVRRREARAASSIVPWRVAVCDYVKQTQTSKEMSANSATTLSQPSSWERLTVSLSRCHFKWKNCTCWMWLEWPRWESEMKSIHSLTVSPLKNRRGIANQRRCLAWLMARFSALWSTKDIQAIGLILKEKRAFPFLVNSQHSKPWQEPNLYVIFPFPQLFFLFLDDLCPLKHRSPLYILSSFTDSLFTWTMPELLPRHFLKKCGNLNLICILVPAKKTMFT